MVRAYDEVAAAYAEAFSGELACKPFDRGVLEGFAAALPAGSPVADFGCGPGQVARFLKGCGPLPLGVDLSPETVALARRFNPDMRFAVSAMRKPEFPAETFAGIVSFCAIIHLNRAWVVQTLFELRRVLKPGGRLLVSFHIGEGETQLETWFCRPVSLSFMFFQPDEVAAFLAAAGLRVLETSVRPPYDFGAQTERAYLSATR